MDVPYRALIMDIRKYLPAIDHYQKEGYVFPVRGLFTEERLDAVDHMLSEIVENRPKSLPPEDLLNLHLTCTEVLDLCKEPTCLRLASELLGSTDLSVFTSRILCKLPRHGKEIQWHQDALYWPLQPPLNPEEHNNGIEKVTRSIFISKVITIFIINPQYHNIEKSFVIFQSIT